MKLLNKLNVDFDFEDERGGLTQLVHTGYEQVNVLVTNKGVERGGHYHKQSNECFFVVSGSVEVTAKYEDTVEVEIFRKKDFFEIKPNIIHSMYFPEDCIMVAMYDKCVELSDGSKDIFSE